MHVRHVDSAKSTWIRNKFVTLKKLADADTFILSEEKKGIPHAEGKDMFLVLRWSPINSNTFLHLYNDIINTHSYAPKQLQVSSWGSFYQVPWPVWSRWGTNIEIGYVSHSVWMVFTRMIYSVWIEFDQENVWPTFNDGFELQQERIWNYVTVSKVKWTDVFDCQKTSNVLWYFTAPTFTKCTLKMFQCHQHNLKIWLTFANYNTPRNMDIVFWIVLPCTTESLKWFWFQMLGSL